MVDISTLLGLGFVVSTSVLFITLDLLYDWYVELYVDGITITEIPQPSLDNGGFETGDFSEWDYDKYLYRHERPVGTTHSSIVKAPYEGTYSLKQAISGNQSYTVVSQAIGSRGEYSGVSFAYNVFWIKNPPSDHTFAGVWINIFSSTGVFLGQEAFVDNEMTDGWQIGYIDLSGYPASATGDIYVSTFCSYSDPISDQIVVYWDNFEFADDPRMYSVSFDSSYDIIVGPKFSSSYSILQSRQFNSSYSIKYATKAFDSSYDIESTGLKGFSSIYYIRVAKPFSSSYTIKFIMPKAFSSSYDILTSKSFDSSYDIVSIGLKGFDSSYRILEGTGFSSSYDIKLWYNKTFTSGYHIRQSKGFSSNYTIGSSFTIYLTESLFVGVPVNENNHIENGEIMEVGGLSDKGYFPINHVHTDTGRYYLYDNTIDMGEENISYIIRLVNWLHFRINRVK